MLRGIEANPTQRECHVTPRRYAATLRDAHNHVTHSHRLGRLVGSTAVHHNAKRRYSCACKRRECQGRKMGLDSPELSATTREVGACRRANKRRRPYQRGTERDDTKRIVKKKKSSRRRSFSGNPLRCPSSRSLARSFFVCFPSVLSTQRPSIFSAVASLSS